jgi:diamine N-acetyltransferase
MINKDNRGKGYSREALDLVINYCFNTLMVHQLFCNISSENEISMKLFTSTGFDIIGNKKDWLHINNQWKDEYLLQLINKKNK